MSDSATPCIAARKPSLFFTVSQSLLKLKSIESVMPSNHLILCYSLLLLPSISPSIRVFCKELALCIMWSKYWSFSFIISPSNEYSVLISFRIDWLLLLLFWCSKCLRSASGTPLSCPLSQPLWSLSISLLLAQEDISDSPVLCLWHKSAIFSRISNTS